MELDACLAWLKAHKKDSTALRRLADRSGISFYTILKIARGDTKDPGINTMVAVLNAWPSVAAENSEAA